MNIDMYVYMMFCECVRHVFTRVYVGGYTWVICRCMHIHLYAHNYVHACIYRYICKSTYMDMNMYIWIYVCVCIGNSECVWM